MKLPPARLALPLSLLLIGAAGTGYWFGSRSSHTLSDAAPAAAASPAAPSAPARKLLYYRNPMGLADTSATPKKDPMGMDYIPVYEGEDTAAATPDAGPPVTLSAEKIQKLGVRTEAAALRPLDRQLRVAGRVEPDERRVTVITPKFEGYIERLHVNATGQAVARGQALFEVYSPDLLSAQREYVIALQGLQALQAADAETRAGLQRLAEATLARLRHWDLSPEDIAALVKTGEPRRTVSLRSPAAGIVTDKKAFEGMRFMPGDALYQLSELSTVWVLADVPEQDLGLLQPGAKASLSFSAFPGQRFEGRVSYVYPTLKAETRSVPVRIELGNPHGRLKPGLFAQVELAVASGAAVLTVPESAVIDSGTRRIVLVRRGEGRFEPREVTLGARGDSLVEVLQGLRPGEPVAVAANFLIDAESNLRAAIGAMAPPAPPASPASSAASLGR